MRLREDLSIDVSGYGRYAGRAWWSGIREGIDDIIRQIKTKQLDPDALYLSEAVSVSFQAFKGNLPISGEHAALL